MMSNNNKTITDYIFDFAYGEAVTDATRRVVSAGVKEQLSNCRELKNIVRNYIDEILDETASEKSFFNTISTIYQKCENIDVTFGHIQKLINMTAKYMYIICYNDESLKNNFKHCHCPMDSYMIAYVKAKYREQTGENPLQFKKYTSSKGKEITSWSDVSWSRIPFSTNNDKNMEIPDVYIQFQQMVETLSKKEKEGMEPLEYDFKHWENAKNLVNSTNKADV